tara:strand:- start:129 stop:656 length:528 start_codon:yes stop_codon:yes gene_type:complete
MTSEGSVGLATLRSLIRQELNTRDEVSASALARELTQEHGESDWWDLLQSEMFTYALYQEVVRQVAQTRKQGSVVYGDKSIKPERLQERIEHIRNKRMNGMEWLGENRYKRVAKLNRAEVLDAAHARRERGDLNNRYAMFWETLAQRMDDVQIVEDVATDEDLDALHALINRRND